MRHHGIPVTGGLKSAARTLTLEFDADIKSGGGCWLENRKFLLAVQKIHIGRIRTRLNIRPEFHDFRDERVARGAPRRFGTGEEFSHLLCRALELEPGQSGG